MFPRLYLHTYMFSRLKYCTTGSETYISEIYKMHFLNIGYNIIYCVYCILMLHNLYTIYIILFYTMYKQSQLYRYKTHTHTYTHIRYKHILTTISFYLWGRRHLVQYIVVAGEYLCTLCIHYSVQGVLFRNHCSFRVVKIMYKLCHWRWITCTV